MSEDDARSGSDRAHETPRERAARKRRLEQVFGEGLPDQTSDDPDEPRRRAEEDKRTEEWLRRQVPPHHG